MRSARAPRILSLYRSGYSAARSGRRDQIHVTGRVILDNLGRPSRVDEVEKIERLDLSPIEVTRLDFAGTMLRARAPVLLFLVQEEEAAHQWLTLVPNTLGLQTVAPTRSQLVDAVRDEIRLLWREFVREDDRNLTASGIALKRVLVETFEEVAHAA
jgi:hypothetical protein